MALHAAASYASSGGAETNVAPLLQADLVHTPKDLLRHGEKGRGLPAVRRSQARRERRQVQTGRGEPKTGKVLVMAGSKTVPPSEIC